MQLEHQAGQQGATSPAWRLIVAFVIAGGLCSVVASIVAVYVLGWYDTKFAKALSSALQVQLLDMALSLLAAVAVFAVVVAARIRRGAGESVKRAALLGAIYPLGSLLLWRIMMQLDPESFVAPSLAIAYVVLYPALAAVAIRKVR